MELQLEPLTLADLGKLQGWIPDEEFLIQWAGPAFRYPLDRKQLERHWRSSQGERPARRIYKALPPGSPVMAGSVELNRIDRRNGSASLSRAIIGDPAFRGRGAGKAMIDAVLSEAFNGLKLHRVELIVFDHNDRALNCYKRAGFKAEGLLRDYRLVKGRYWSAYIMSILEHEWRHNRG